MIFQQWEYTADNFSHAWRSIRESLIFYSANIALCKMCSGHPKLISHFLHAEKIKRLHLKKSPIFDDHPPMRSARIPSPVTTARYYQVSPPLLSNCYYIFASSAGIVSRSRHVTTLTLCREQHYFCTLLSNLPYRDLLTF